jgi:ATP-dependent Clp protease ATP-binding subunit ClpA
MDINRFTEKAQEALQAAHRRALRESHQQVDVEHLFLALLEQSDGLAVPLLQKAGLNRVDRLQERLEQELRRLPAGQRACRYRPGLYHGSAQPVAHAGRRGSKETAR